MTAPSEPISKPARPKIATRPWVLRTVLAGLAAISAGVLASKSPWEWVTDTLPGQAVAVLAGWLMFLVLLPWRPLMRLSHLQHDLALFAATVRRLNPADRSMPLRTLPVERIDELGDAAKAVHDALAAAIASRLEVKTIQRTMDESIRRETARATMQLQKEALTDPLTGLGNRRSLDQFWERMLDPQGRLTRSCAFILIDLDGFKPINDVLGHDAGDEVLELLGRIIQSALRQNDTAVRLGGDEFLIVLPEHPEHDAQVAAERLEALFRQIPWKSREVPRPSFSFGTSIVHRGEISTCEAMLKRADAAMYQNKQRRKQGGSKQSAVA